MPDLPSALKVDDDYLLKVCLEAERDSVGFENDYDLSHDRIEALNYYKGNMPDMPVPTNRSKAHSTDVSDAIETVLPDLVEIFIGGEDVATFQATNQADEAGAKQETEYVNHVILKQNDGFDVFYTSIKDALLSKTGVIKWWWEERKAAQSEDFTGQTQMDLALAQQAAQKDPGTSVDDIEPEPYDQEAAFEAQQNGQPPPEQTYKFTVNCAAYGKVCIETVAPEDFTVARDTVKLRDASYACMRSRPRAQDLLAMGYDADKVAQLPPYGAPSLADQVQQARDTAGEQTQFMAASQSDPYLRQVQITEHFIKLVGDDAKPAIWRVVTGGSGEGGVVLETERVNRIQFAAVTPYPMTHRFYGRSVADLLIEIQRIKTALTRMLLDSGYFALNQRVQVDMTYASEFTLDDLLRQEPAIPVRTKGNAITPIEGPGLGFDVNGALEAMSVASEQRTGILRNSQGLDPDTLHDTATGAMAMLNNAQKRVRMIARIFAETGYKDLWLGVHEMIRTHAERPEVVRLTGGWVQIDPTQWGERDDMEIVLGVGSGGAQQELAAFAQGWPVMQAIWQTQGGRPGPLLTVQNLYAFLSRFFTRGLQIKTIDDILTDPSSPQAQQAQAAQAQQPPPPDPKMVEVQNKAQLAQQEMQADQQLQAQRLQTDQQQAQVKAQSDMQIAQAKIQADIEVGKYKADLDAQLQREQIQADMQIKREQMTMEARTDLMKAQLGSVVQGGLPDGMGGQPGGPVGGDMGGPTL